MMSRQAYLVVGVACALAVTAVAFNRPAARDGAGAGRPRVTGASAMWLRGGGAVPAYRVVRDGGVVWDSREGAGGAPPLRVDFELDGRPVTLWFRDPGSVTPADAVAEGPPRRGGRPGGGYAGGGGD